MFISKALPSPFATLTHLSYHYHQYTIVITGACMYDANRGHELFVPRQFEFIIHIEADLNESHRPKDHIHERRPGTSTQLSIINHGQSPTT